MSNTINALVMLALTLAVFMGLAKLLQALRAGRLVLPWQRHGAARPPMAPARMVIEQSCMIDGKRRLLLLRCDEQRIVLLTGGPADLVVSVLPVSGAAA
jgi:hypothetical protein